MGTANPVILSGLPTVTLSGLPTVTLSGLPTVILSGAKNLATWKRPGAEFTLSGTERLRAGPWLEPGGDKSDNGKALVSAPDALTRSGPLQ